ncbi:MAG TPA: aminomethyltransferase beta-barrel domain-containing protein, partial [Gammaproteobacteria bacterium]|nr:aminomethyltransferase beta-barrel domain-containing protein [Gammaproteobacteria bacterium]
YQNWRAADRMHWINSPPPGWSRGAVLRCGAKTRYRQADQTCAVVRRGAEGVELWFEAPQRAVTPGQYAVLYQGERCLGGATIRRAAMRPAALEAAG